MQVTVDGRLVNYQTAGNGKNVLFLHGWASDSRVFDPIARNIAKDYSFISLDLPGFGGSQAPETAWGLDNYAKFVAEFLAKIDVQQLYAVIAHSNGAAVAIKALATESIKAERLVILGGAGIRSVNKGRKKFLRVVAKTGKPFLMLLPKAPRAKIRSRWNKSIGPEMLLVPQMEKTFKKTIAEDVLKESRKVDTQTLLLYGENDTATPPLFGRLYFENMSAATLEIIKDAGHFIFIDQPQKVTKLIQEFLG